MKVIRIKGRKYRIREGSWADSLTDPSFYAGGIILAAFWMMPFFMVWYGH